MPDSPSDSTSLSELRSRPDKALTEIVEAHFAYLFRAALGLGLPQAEAEDLVQDTFATFIASYDRFEGRSSVRTYLYGILYRKNLERGRRKSRELATDPADEVFESRFGFMGKWQKPPQGPVEAALSRETEALIHQCMDGLNEDQRAVFHLKMVEGEANENIRNILGISDTHLRVLLFRARNKLRECLEKKWKSDKT